MIEGLSRSCTDCGIRDSIAVPVDTYRPRDGRVMLRLCLGCLSSRRLAEQRLIRLTHPRAEAAAWVRIAQALGAVTMILAAGAAMI